MAEHPAVNRRVVGSSPTRGAHKGPGNHGLRRERGEGVNAAQAAQACDQLPRTSLASAAFRPCDWMMPRSKLIALKFTGGGGPWDGHELAGQQPADEAFTIGGGGHAYLGAYPGA